MSEAELVKRLERLERDNRRLKKLGAAALVVAVALGTMAATRAVPQKIVAHEFDLVDGAGNVRAKLVMMRTTGSATIPVLAMGAWLRLGANGLSIEKRDTAGHLASAELSASGLTLLGERPNISLTDSQGFVMELGSARTPTITKGGYYQTSADSIVMFANDRKPRVIWKAPR